jgi:hypothetical protein
MDDTEPGGKREDRAHRSKIQNDFGRVAMWSKSNKLKLTGGSAGSPKIEAKSSYYGNRTGWGLKLSSCRSESGGWGQGPSCLASASPRPALGPGTEGAPRKSCQINP